MHLQPKLAVSGDRKRGLQVHFCVGRQRNGKKSGCAIFYIDRALGGGGGIINGKRGRCALCTINKEDIKTMKQIKKLASLLLAAVLAMTLLAGCGGRGGNVGTAVTEQSILKYINKARAAADVGLSPVKNDPTLANAAAKLLNAFAETEMIDTNYGTGYKLSKDRVESTLHALLGKNNQEIRIGSSGGMITGSFFYVAPTNETSYGIGGGSQDDNCYLLRRANKFINSDDYYGYGNTLYNFLGTSDVVLASNMKVGIAFREINGERFALLVYDVTITPTTPAP